MTDVAKPLTEPERQAIVDLLPTGKSCRQIAAEVGRSVDTVSRIAQAVGHTFGQLNVARAHEARSAYAQEARAEIAQGAAERARKLLAGFEGEQAHVTSMGEVVMAPLDAKGEKDRAQAVQMLTRTVLDIDRHDARTDEGKAKGLLERLVEGLEATA